MYCKNTPDQVLLSVLFLCRSTLLMLGLLPARTTFAHIQQENDEVELKPHFLHLAFAHCAGACLPVVSHLNIAKQAF